MYLRICQLICTILLVGCQQRTAARVISLSLYKHRNYDTIEKFRSNAAAYRASLQYFFSDGVADQATGKFDLNVDYLANIQLGFGPSQRFTVTLDSSFSGLWIPSSNCILSWDCYVKNTFRKKDSTDYRQDILNNQAQNRYITFGETDLFGSKNQLSGDLGYDTLTLEGTAVPGQHFLEATRISRNPFSSAVTDGVLGLGFPSPQLRMETPLRTILDRGILDRSIFSIYLGTPTESGEITFGGWKMEYFQVTTLEYHDVTSTKYGWTIAADSIKLQDQELCVNGCDILVDTGSALIVLPRPTLEAFYQALGQQYNGEIAEVSCTDRWTLPVLELKFDDQPIRLNGFDYTIEIEEDKTCVLGLTEGTNQNLWILGNLFLKKVYSVFDVGQQRIGFAKLVPQHSSSGSRLSEKAVSERLAWALEVH